MRGKRNGLEAEALWSADRMLAELCETRSRLDAGAVGRVARRILAAERAGGRLHLMGIGKSAAVGRFIAASMCSTGTPANFLDAADALHGSAGVVRKGDVVIALSNSGRTAEAVACARLLKGLGASIVGISADRRSPLARLSDDFLEARVSHEGDRLNLAPRASVLAALYVLNVLSAALQAAKGLTKRQFQRWHPGGALGRR